MYAQGHIDMVTEQNSDSTHNFFEDPISLIRQDDWIKVRMSVPLILRT